MRIPLILSAGLLLIAAAPSHAATVPTVDVSVADEAIVLSGHEHLDRGPVRLSLRREPGGDPHTIAVVELAPGRTAQDIGSLGGLVDARPIERIGRLVAGATVHPNAPVAISIDARARRYVLMDATGEGAAPAEFEPDAQRSGATLPRPDATIDLHDDRITAPPVLPRRGTIRVRNRGARAHQALAIRLPAGTTAGAAVAALRNGRSPERVGEPVDLESLISTGVHVDVERPLKRGRYVLASFSAGRGPHAKPDVYRGLIATTKVR